MTDLKFEKAASEVLSHGGGLVSDPDDPGGTTNFGISLRFAKSIEDIIDMDLDDDGDVDADDIAKLTKEEAVDIYKIMFWDKYLYGSISSSIISTKLFDLSVNMGPRQAHKIIQRALRACDQPVKDDGIIGSITRSEIESLTIVKGRTLHLLFTMRAEAAGFYRMIIKRNPVFKKYEEGWLIRAYS